MQHVVRKRKILSEPPWSAQEFGDRRAGGGTDRIVTIVRTGTVLYEVRSSSTTNDNYVRMCVRTWYWEASSVHDGRQRRADD